MSHGGGGEEEEGGGERWLVSYSDFITLLMVLFVVLYSMGQIDVEKYKRLAESMRTAFSVGSASNVVDAEINANGGTMEDGTPKPLWCRASRKARGLGRGGRQLTALLAEQNLGSEVSVQTNIEGLDFVKRTIGFRAGYGRYSQRCLPGAGHDC
jgi:chemotaxis protein MotB